MTAHQGTEAVEQPQTGNPLDDILRLAGEEVEAEAQPTEDEPEPELETEEGEDPEAAEEPEEGEQEDGEDAEPEEAISAPVSLNKQQKAAFAQLPPELQKVWAESEAQRNMQVQQKTTEAAEATKNARQEAFSAAQSELAKMWQQTAAELEVYASAFQPMEPDHSLLATNPQAYAEQIALSKQLGAQHQQMMQRIGELRQGSEQITQQQRADVLASEQAKLRSAWPEFFDPAKQSSLWQDVAATGKDMGFSEDVLANATASEILALKNASEWRSKAAKWDDFQSRKMAGVRAAKALPKAATPGIAPSRVVSKAARADQAWERAKQSRSGEAYADFLEASGIKL